MTNRLACAAFAACLSLSTLVRPTSLPAPDPAPPRLSAPPEAEAGGFLLFQPFNHADGVVADGTHTHNGKTYTQTKVRWAPVGFLYIVESDEEGQRLEHWYLSKVNENSSTSNTTAPFVEPYFWPGRATPAAEKHAYWNDLPVRFLRRNDLSGAADLSEFVAEVGTTYGYDLSASAGDFTRQDATAATASGY